MSSHWSYLWVILPILGLTAKHSCVKHERVGDPCCPFHQNFQINLKSYFSWQLLFWAAPNIGAMSPNAVATKVKICTKVTLLRRQICVWWNWPQFWNWWTNESRIWCHFIWIILHVMMMVWFYKCEPTLPRMDQP